MSIARQMMMAAAGGAGGGGTPPITRSISLNGASALYNLNVPSTVWGSSPSFTYEAWVKPSSVSGYRGVLGKGYAGGGMMYVLSGAIVFYLGATRVSGGTVSVGAWSHIAITQNASVLRAYLNGVNVGTATYSPSISAPEVLVGGSTGPASSPPNTEFFAGLIARPRVSNTVRYEGSFTPVTDYENDASSVFYVDVVDGAITELNGVSLSSVGTPTISTDIPT